MGQTHSLQPRVLHISEHTILLVSALYVCPAGHEVSATDPRLMECIKESLVVHPRNQSSRTSASDFPANATVMGLVLTAPDHCVSLVENE